MKCTACRNREAESESVICAGCAESIRDEVRKRQARESAQAEAPRDLPARPRTIAGLLKAILALVSGLSSLVSASEPDPAVVALRGVRWQSQCDNGVCTRTQATFLRGSAVAIDAANKPGKPNCGYIYLTARHCVDHGATDRYQVFSAGAWRTAAPGPHVSKCDDVAWIAVESAEPQALECLAERDPLVGEEIRIAGFQLGLDYRTQRGRVVEQDEQEATQVAPHEKLLWAEMESQGAVIDGQSGGVVFDTRGNIAGIVVQHNGVKPWRGGFVPVSRIRAWLKRDAAANGSSVAGGEVPRRMEEEGPRGEGLGLRAGEGDSDEQIGTEPNETTPKPQVNNTKQNPSSTPVSPVAPPPPENLEKNPEKSPTPAEGVSAEVGKILAGEEITSPVTREKEPISPPVAQPSSVNPQRSKAWWDFATSGLGLGLTIAGAVATGGVTAVTVAAPALKFLGSLREVVQAHRGRRVWPASTGATSVPGQVGEQGLRRASDPATPPLCGPSSPTLSAPESEGEPPTKWPFPRALEEARSLLRLREAEGRAPLLDSLRGVFLDDELEKLSGTGDATTQALVTRLRKAIEDRVNEVAPLSVKV